MAAPLFQAILKNNAASRSEFAHIPVGSGIYTREKARETVAAPVRILYYDKKPYFWMIQPMRMKRQCCYITVDPATPVPESGASRYCAVCILKQSTWHNGAVA